jgi:hypothetical protein
MVAASLVMGNHLFAESATVSVSANNVAKIKIAVDTGTVDFGDVDATGQGSYSAGVTATERGDDSGTDFVIGDASGTGAVQVTVKSNKTWTSKAKGTANGGTSDMALGDLGYRNDGTGGYTAFTTSDVTLKSAQAKGVDRQKYDYQLYVKYASTLGTFSTTITYTATQD